ncbi:MAG: phenylalanine--tRNA ligase subunit alpha [Armatimonadetes bacterium]|nr:phenylalanine--tRNA ligase subunit alpha [Armatimonadota bacterium]
MNDQLTTLQSEAQERIARAGSLAELEEVETAYLGRKGSVTQLLRGLGSLPPEERPAAGARINEAKARLQSLIDDKRDALSAASLQAQLEAERVDVTLPGRRLPPGGVHPLARTLDEIQEIFVGMGFEFVDSPDVETVFYNFSGLNYPPDHPAYDQQMSFYLTDDLLLRTQCTAFQRRYFDTRQPPMKLATAGRVYRYEQVDPTHAHTYYNVDGILIDRDVSLGDLFGTLDSLMKKIYGADVRTRFRPHYFPFTEPSAELDLSCIFCGGEGCRICKYEGWVELLGCGMIHPNILRDSGIDTEEFTGFAFGMGPDRVAMNRMGVEDIRMFLDNDLRLLEQF